MRVGIIGDSQAQGLRRTLIPALEAKGYQITGAMTVVGMGLANMRADPSRVSRARAVARESDTLIVILGGNNHAGRERYRELLDWFLRDVVRTGQRVIWVGPANSPRVPYHQQTRAFQKEYFGLFGRVKWIDTYGMTTGLPGDGIHFNREGYEEWTQRLVPELFVDWSSLIGGALLGAAAGIFLAMRR